MFKITVVDNITFSVGYIDECETQEEALVLKDAYEEDYPKEEGYDVGIEECGEEE